MKRIVVIGPGGAGKSVLASELARKTGLPLLHLDSMYWQPGWVATPTAAWRLTVASLVTGDAWIIDGNFGGTLDIRLEAADTIILMDLPPWLCAWRVVQRRLRYHRRSRPDMRTGCDERLSLPFLWWVLTYRSRRLPALLSRLERAEAQGKRVHVLRSSRAVAQFLDDAA